MATNGRPGTDLVSSGDLTVRADPDKLFFIENLVKDIELIPAILDLADNSVDSARQIALANLKAETARPEYDDNLDSVVDLPAGAFRGLKVELIVAPGSFEVNDNCAGMALDVAQKYAFRFGRSRAFEGLPGSVGQFGVGMKRALFKLGRWFSVESRSTAEWFDLEVDVDRWLSEQDEQDWTFKFKAATVNLPAPTDAERGTRIEVGRLHATVQDDFQDELVLSLLREQLRLRHQEAIDRGLLMHLNGEKLSGLRPALMSGPTFGALRKSWLVEVSAGSVTVELIAGIVKSNRREAGVNEGNAEHFRSASEAGWWVFCNNRLLLVADKSSETGWGKGAAAYHPQYRLFRGYVYMSALETSLLPWNTTKTGVDADSVVWRRVQGEMVSALVDVQAVLNRLKKEREELSDDEDDAGTADFPDAPYVRALAAAESVPLRSLPRSSSVIVPTIPTRTTPPRRKTWQKMQYDVPREQFDRAMSVLGFSTMAKLGRRSFDYFYKREVEDQ